MFCNECGEQIDKETVICKSCDSRIEDVGSIPGPLSYGAFIVWLRWKGATPIVGPLSQRNSL